MSQRSNNLEIVFVILTKVVTFYIIITIIKVQVFWLEEPVEIITIAC